MPVSIPSVLNYMAFNFYGVSLTYWVLSAAFERRRSPLLWYSYFAVRTVVDSNLWWIEEYGSPSPQIVAFHLAWRTANSLLGFLIIWQCWKGDYVLLGVCAVICDPIASEMNTVATILSNMACGYTTTVNYFEPIGLHTLLGGLIYLALYVVIRLPLVSLLKLACRFALRHRAFWGVSAILLATLYASITQTSVSYTRIESHVTYTVPVVMFVLAVVAVPLIRQSRAVSQRTKLLESCLELSHSYDDTIRRELASLERDRSVLEGHDVALGRLRDNADQELAGRIENLRLAYKRLSAGSYCDRPALDAVLIAGARRLRESGVDVSLSVAGVPVGAPVPVAAVLTLFNLVSEAAARNAQRQDARVELRVRGIGGQVLLHLEVPARWGALWAKRYLSVFGEDNEVLIRERRQGDRRVVLVLCEGEIA